MEKGQTIDAGRFVQVGIVVLQASYRKDLHLRIPVGFFSSVEISGDERTGSEYGWFKKVEERTKPTP
jgi:hypothetical protein